MSALVVVSDPTMSGWVIGIPLLVLCVLVLWACVFHYTPPEDSYPDYFEGGTDEWGHPWDEPDEADMYADESDAREETRRSKVVDEMFEGMTPEQKQAGLDRLLYAIDHPETWEADVLPTYGDCNAGEHNWALIEKASPGGPDERPTPANVYECRVCGVTEEG